MAKFHGEIGYAGDTTETAPGVWEEQIVEKSYYGDIVTNLRRLQDVDNVNKDIVLSNSISVVADAYAGEHFFAIRYVRWSGTLWTVTSVEVHGPRLLLRLGGVYNGPAI